MNLARLITIAGLARLKSADGGVLFPESTVRGWSHENVDGFRAECVVAVGGKSMVDLDALDGWLEKRRGSKRGRRTARATPSAPVKSFDDIMRGAGLK